MKNDIKYSTAVDCAYVKNNVEYSKAVDCTYEMNDVEYSTTVDCTYVKNYVEYSTAVNCTYVKNDVEYSTDVDCAYITSDVKYSSTDLAYAMNMNIVFAVSTSSGYDDGLVSLCPVCNNVFQPSEMLQASSYLFNTLCSCGTLIYLEQGRLSQTSTFAFDT